MAIFRKVVTRSSKAVFAIQADTKQQADDAFDNYFRDDDNNENFNEYMRETEKDDITDLQAYDNWEEYNRVRGAGITVHDFLIVAETPEPLYDICIRNREYPCALNIYKGKTMSAAAEPLMRWNREYILKPCPKDDVPRMFGFDNVERWEKDAIRRNATMVYFEAERRK